ncbi:hypothetical protein NDU88_004011, partial [Pleurodeles waltl]
VITNISSAHAVELGPGCEWPRHPNYVCLTINKVSGAPLSLLVLVGPGNPCCGRTLATGDEIWA